jgi:hypothetical protein
MRMEISERAASIGAFLTRIRETPRNAGSVDFLKKVEPRSPPTEALREVSQ